MFTRPALGGLEMKNWALRGSEVILGVRERHRKIDDSLSIKRLGGTQVKSPI